MAKRPDKPEEIFPEFREDFQTLFGGELVAIILYGSGAAGRYVPGRSDINFLIVLTEAGVERIDRAIDTVKRWRKRGVSTPLFMTPPYVRDSLDSYPIEFLNMKREHVLVCGQDVLQDLAFEPVHLRLQIERELKGKILHLRTGFLEAEGDARKLRELIRVSLTAFLSLFTALLYLKGAAVSSDRREIVRAVSRILPMDETVFLRCLDIREGSDGLSSAGVKEVFQGYMREIERLCGSIDRAEL
jgi:predicted nucleotidyltransferase